jgi:hypothetical protein
LHNIINEINTTELHITMINMVNFILGIFYHSKTYVREKDLKLKENLYKELTLLE